MANTRRTISRDNSSLEQLFQVFGRAEELYPRLLAQRDYHAAELQKLEAALEKLGHFVTPTTKPPAKPPTLSTARTNGAPGKGTVASLVLAALSSASAPMNAADLAAAVRTQRNVSKANLQNTLRDLRAKGLVKATGKAKRFTYSLGKGGAPRPATAASAKVSPSKKRSARNTGPSLREAAVAALGKGASLSRADLIKAMLAARPDAKATSAAVTIDNLRSDRVLKVSGKKKAYRYSLAK